MESGYIYVANNIFPTLLAISSEEQQHGLMYQEWPPPVMSFVYAKPQINRFWMKNTPSPLDIVFCRDNKILQVCKGEPYSTESLGDFVPTDLVIEFPFGTVISSNIKLGDKIGIVTPSPDQLKKIIAEKVGGIVKI